MTKRGRPKKGHRQGEYLTFLQRFELDHEAYVPPYRQLKGREFEKRKAELEKRERRKRDGSKN